METFAAEIVRGGPTFDAWLHSRRYAGGSARRSPRLAAG